MPEREENGCYAHGNTSGLRFGEGQTRKGNGRPKGCCATVKEYWNTLSAVDEDGNPKHTVADLEKIVKAPKTDKKIPTTKRIAAREILDGLKSGQVGRKVMEFLFDRTEGKARQQIDVNSTLVEVKRIVLVGSDAGSPFLPDHGSPQGALGLDVEQAPVPQLPAPMPIGGLEALLAPAADKASEPIVVNPITTPPPPIPAQDEPEVIEKPTSTRPAPIDLPSPPGRVLGPGEEH